MLAYIARRLGQNVVTLFLIVTLAFFLVQAQPGDYTSVYAQDPKLPPEVRARIQADFGLDKPLGEQYLLHLRKLLHRQLRHILRSLPPVGDGRDH